MKAGLVTVGETLSNARRIRGLSIDDVAAQTRIRSTVIRGIEADDFRLCGGAVYARGHIRSIAKVVGADAAPLVADFDAAQQPDPLAERIVTSVAPQRTDPDVVSRSERRGPNWPATMATVLAVVCVLALGMFIAHRAGGGGSPQAKSPPAATTHQSTPAPATSPSITPPPQQQTADRATMLVRSIHGRTWLSITSKTGTLLFEGILAPGEQKKFTNRHGLTFVIGNAPAVDVVVNGHDIGEPPSSGNVSRGDVSPGADNVQQA